jgi:hypothetical protein
MTLEGADPRASGGPQLDPLVGATVVSGGAGDTTGCSAGAAGVSVVEPPIPMVLLRRPISFVKYVIA